MTIRFVPSIPIFSIYLLISPSPAQAIVTTVANGIGTATATAGVRDHPTIAATDEERETPMPILQAEAIETESARIDTLDAIVEATENGIAIVARLDGMPDATMMTGSRDGIGTRTMTADARVGIDVMKVLQDRKVAARRRRPPRSENPPQI